MRRKDMLEAMAARGVALGGPMHSLVADNDIHYHRVV